MKKPDYSARLYTPTQIVELDGQYFIIDCWHHRIIYSDNLHLPISQWKVLDDQLSGPHSIASDGDLFVSENTGNNSIVTYRKVSEAEFRKHEEIPNVGKRPHRTIYDFVSRLFYVVSGNDQGLHIFEKIGGALRKIGFCSFPQFSGQYIRSITLHRNRLYFICFSLIIVMHLPNILNALGGSSEGAEIERVVQLHPAHQWPTDIFFIGDESGLLSCKRSGLFAFSIIDELASGEAKDMSDFLLGTPYFVTRCNQKLYVPEIDQYSRIVEYNMVDGKVNFDDSTVLFDFG